jgi:membrane-associated phospholipid phosphatase
MSAAGRLRAHVRGLWPRYPWLPALPFVGWPAYCVSRGEYRWEFLVVVFLGGVLPYIGPRAKRLYLGILPVGLVGLLYDGMRFVKNVGLSRETVHVCDLRAIDSRWFGFHRNGEASTVHDYLQAHASLPLDVFFSVPYGTFIGAAVAFAVFLYFQDYPAMRRFMGAFLLMNVAGFVTYHLYPAAPPWYYHQHGCAVDLATRANEGPNLARVDAWLGVSYFHGFYGRSNDVFGAVPSLHVAYPLLIALEGWAAFGSLRPSRRWLLRALSLSFVLWMATAAIYLDHHWVVDVVVGMAYGFGAFAVLRLAAKRGNGEASSRSPPPLEGARTT